MYMYVHTHTPSRNGFLRDCAQVPPEPNILSPNFADPTDPYDLNSHHFYIHHTGTALVQPVVELHTTPTSHHHNSTSPHHTSSADGHDHRNSGSLSSPLAATRTDVSELLCLHPCGGTGTSTPLVRSPAKTTRSEREGSGTSSDGASRSTPEEQQRHTSSSSGGGLKCVCGFYWYRNYLLPKQKNVPPGLVGRYSEVLEKFKDDCQNKDSVLNHLYDHLFT